MERSSVKTLPARATAAPRALLDEEKERHAVDEAGVEGGVRRKAKVAEGKSRRRTTAWARRRRCWEVDGGILSYLCVTCSEGVGGGACP